MSNTPIDQQKLYRTFRCDLYDLEDEVRDFTDSLYKASHVVEEKRASIHNEDQGPEKYVPVYLNYVAGELIAFTRGLAHLETLLEDSRLQESDLEEARAYLEELKESCARIVTQQARRYGNVRTQLAKLKEDYPKLAMDYSLARKDPEYQLIAGQLLVLEELVQDEKVPVQQLEENVQVVVKKLYSLRLDYEHFTL